MRRIYVTIILIIILILYVFSSKGKTVNLRQNRIGSLLRLQPDYSSFYQKNNPTDKTGILLYAAIVMCCPAPSKQKHNRIFLCLSRKSWSEKLLKKTIKYPDI